ncbi:MAG TPA: Nif3-like dinuclear metal center hexameric protein [Clostridiales bacterium]|nr:Nif3-like dinuclear metal center hexameric protein [Clostridiales bacterium]
MLVAQILKILEKIAPLEIAFDYDNVGLIIGGTQKQVRRALLTLDCTKNVVEYAIEHKVDVIITHHPVIFNPIKSIDSDTVVYKLVQNDICCIAMHTNLDLANGGVNDRLCEKLALKNPVGIIPAKCEGYYQARLAKLESEFDVEEFVNYVKQKLSLNSVRFTKGEGPIKTVAVCSGSGGDLLSEVIASGADAFVTADVKHSTFVKADELKFTLIDAGHFETEDVVIEPLLKTLQEQLPQIEFMTYHENPIKYL